MAKISLRMYNREIEGLIEQAQRLDEAIAHSRHILKTYPKHLETYRLLGKAYLEAKRYDAAVDIFQRVLVVVPDDFVSHVGMSIIADDKGNLDDAIWHMERAFEVQPANAAIQSELQRLFGRRDGIEPPKIRLTRGALAHMYVQGELFPQAISEIRAVLSNDPRRTDMQTLLARAYYRNGQKAEAAELCTELLSKYPYCLDANRLMSEIAPSTQHAETAQEYRKRVIELDPYAAFAQDSIFHADTVADNLVTIERLEYTGVTAETPSALGISLEPDTSATTRTSAVGMTPPGGTAPANVPSWLQGTADETPAPAPAQPAAPSQEDIPEFLRKAGWGAASEAPTEEPPAPAPSEPEPGGAVEGELPEWVRALAPKEEPAAPAPVEPIPPAEQDVFEAKPAAAESFAADTPDWLRDLGPAPAQPVAPATEPPSPVSTAPTLPPDAPDWMRDLGPAPAQAEPAAPEPMPASTEAPTLPPDVPDWLRDMGPAVTAAAVPSAAEPAEETPDWLKDLAGRELDEPATPAPQQPVADASDWLNDLRSAEAAPVAAEPTEESPEWLKEFDNDLETPLPKTTRLEPPQAEVPTPEPPAPPTPAVAIETPKPVTAESGLGSLGTTAQEQDDAMAWLESLAAKHGAKPEELVTDPNARTDVAPEWVDKAKQIGEQEPEQEQPAGTPISDETGIWLRKLRLEDEKAAAEEPTGVVPEPEPPEEKLFDFRSGFEDQAVFTEPEPEPHKEEPPVAQVPDDTPDWLRGFTPKATARPGMEDAPEWLRGMSAPETGSAEEASSVQRSEASVPTARLRPLPESEPTPPPAAESPHAAESGNELPAWLAGLDENEEAAAGRATPSEPLADELPAWLQSEIEPEPEAKQPANPADWHPAQQKPAEVEPPAREITLEPAKTQEPVVQAPPPSAPVEQPAPVSEIELPAEPVKPPEPERPAPPPPVEVTQPVEERPAAPAPEPMRVEPQPPVPHPEPVRAEQPVAPPARPRAAAPAKTTMPSLSDAQLQLGRGDITGALATYSKLIRKGKSLEDIIRDLRDALYRYPVEVPLWQSLGDAYMRANRLQEALDAYTKAEELLR